MATKKKTKERTKKRLDTTDANALGSTDYGQAESPLPLLDTTSPTAEGSTARQNKPEPVNVDLDPHSQAQQLNEQGNDAFNAERYGEAVDFYTKALELRPAESTYLTNRAACHMALKNFRIALADCQKAAALEAAAPSAETLVRVAKCHLALGTPNAALSAVRIAISVDLTHAPAREVERSARSTEEHLGQFDSARTRGDWDLARISLDEAVQASGGYEPLQWRCWRIEVELATGRLEQASLTAESAFQIDQMEPDVLYLRGLVTFLRGELPAAQRQLQLALTYAPDHSRARVLIRRVRDVERLKDEGKALFKAGKFGDAIDKYSEARDIVGMDKEEAGGGAIRATILSNRATALLKLDWYDDALADANASLELVGTSYKALRTRARIHAKREAYQDAVNDYKVALEQVRNEDNQDERRRLDQELREAVVAIKRSKTKDHYAILGLPKDCTEADIKKAYRKQSLLHHPDRGGDEERFKLASDAYKILLDPQERARYDEEFGGGMSPEDFAEVSEAFGVGSGGFSFGGFEGSSLFGGRRFDTHSHDGGQGP